MKSYPSIGKNPKPGGEKFWIFEKIDGSNLRFEWDRKQGFHRCGTRTKLLSVDDPVLGMAKPIFDSNLSEPLSKIAHDSRWESAIFFAEFYGPKSFAGHHVADDTFKLALFDAAPYKNGILGPQEFMVLFEDIPDRAHFLGMHFWDEAFLGKVRSGTLSGLKSVEGVVGKRGSGHNLEMVKAKTDQWIADVRSHFSPEEAGRIVSS